MSRKSTHLVFLFALLSVATLSANAQQALSLNATSSQYVSTTLDVIPTSGDITVELLVYVPSSGALDGKQHAFVYEGANYGDFSFYLGYNGTTGEITAGDFWDGGTGGNTGVPMPLDQWVHLAFVGDVSNNNVHLFLNGTEVGTPPAAYSITGSGTPFQIGLQGDLTTYVTAQIKNVRVWGTQRTAAELKNDAYRAIPSTTTNLIAAYNMDDANATNLTNNAGSGGIAVQGTLHGTPTPSYVASPFTTDQNAVRLNPGPDDQHRGQVVADYNPAYLLTSGGTIEMWIKPTSLSASNSTLIANRGPFGTNWSFHLSNAAIGLWNNSSFNSIPITVTADDNTWTHLAFVYDGAGTTTIYQNAGLVGQITSTPFSGLANQPLSIGVAKNSGADVEPLGGAVDEVRIWSTQRTAGEIATNKDLTLHGSETGLVGLWGFDQGTADGSNQGVILVPDNTPTANAASLLNFAGTGTGVGTSNYIAHTELTPLPVTLTKFTVVKQGTTALLQWQTAQEQNSKDFTIQRSNDGVKFTGIGSVAAAGNSNATLNYAFVDPSPVVGKNYYRLLQSDLDGKSSYSPVKVLQFANTGNLVWYSTGSRTVEVNLQNGTNENYLITDISGKLIRQGQLSNGRTTLSKLTAGVYVVKVYDKAGVAQTTKVVL